MAILGLSIRENIFHLLYSVAFCKWLSILVYHVAQRSDPFGQTSPQGTLLACAFGIFLCETMSLLRPSVGNRPALVNDESPRYKRSSPKRCRKVTSSHLNPSLPRLQFQVTATSEISVICIRDQPVRFFNRCPELVDILQKSVLFPRRKIGLEIESYACHRFPNLLHTSKTAAPPCPTQ
jgi:hypothetical protein